MSVSSTVSRLCALSTLLAALSTALAGCGLEAGSGGSEGEPSAPTVELVTVDAELLRDMSTFSGQLSAEHSVLIKSETDGVIESVLFEEGQAVEEDEVLFRLRSREQAARLREAQAREALALEVYNRTHKLASRDAVSAAAQDEAAAELAVAKARVELARVALDRMEIRAPFNGVLGMRLVSPGDRITDEDPLVQIDAVDRLQVSFAISELGILFTRVGAPVEVRVAPYPGEIFRGEIFFVSPTLDPSTRRIIAKAWVPNQDHRLRAGLFAKIDMQVDEREQAILVPEAAVVFDREGTYVWKVDADAVAARVPVATGVRRSGWVEITLGLRPGDRIVSAGTHKVKEGKKVVIAAPTRVPLGQARSTPPARSGEGT